MQRMTGIDPMFIYSDTPHTPMEVAYACVFDPSTAEEGYSFERVRDVLSERLPDLLPFRRRLMTVPLGLDHPRWVDDPDFDLGNHLFRVALPEPGGPAQFTEMVAKVMSRSLVADQPPWEMHVIEGLADGRVGLIAKVHHSVVDGVAGAALMAQLLDLNPEGRSVVEDCTPWIPARLPSQARLVADALPNVFTRPIRTWRAVREIGRTAVRMARCATSDTNGPVTIPVGAPRLFETPPGPRRDITFAEMDMREVRALKERFGATVNDVVLGVCSGALRSHLMKHDHDVDSPLVAIVPVSVRETGTQDDGGNRLSAMFVPLSNDCQTPLERLRRVKASSWAGKRQERAVGYGPMASLVTEAMPPALARPVVQFGVRAGVVRRLRAGNLMISNVPGPNFPLYFAGMQMEAVYPLGPVVDGVALNVTVQTYQESLFVGINAGLGAVPDLPGLARAMVDELALLNRMARGPAGPARHHRPSTTPLATPVVPQAPSWADVLGEQAVKRTQAASAPHPDGTDATDDERRRREDYTTLPR
jgi:diacylglycerol O-acyltransferase